MDSGHVEDPEDAEEPSYVVKPRDSVVDPAMGSKVEINLTNDETGCLSNVGQSRQTCHHPDERSEVKSDDPKPEVSNYNQSGVSKPLLNGNQKTNQSEVENGDPDLASGIRVVEAPDGGYGWVIVMCSSFIFMMYGANWIMFSVYIVDFSEVFDKPQAYIGIIGSIDAAFSQITALPAGALVSLYGSRSVCIVGLLVYALGTGLSAFTNNFYTLLVTFGVIKGLGAGMLYIPANMIVQQYFSRRRALAVAFSTGGLSLGTMVFAPIQRILIQTFGWRGALLFFSGVILQCLVFAALMWPHDFDQRIRHKYRAKNSATSDGSKQNCSESSARVIMRQLGKKLTLSYLRDPCFILFISIRILAMLGVVAMYKFCVARAVFMGVDRLLASFLVTCIGICSVTFRYIGGIMANSDRVNRLALYSVSTCMNGAICMVSVVAGSDFYSHAIFYLLYGIFLGTAECIMPTISSDLFGVERLPSTLGWTMCFTGIMILAYMPIFGLLFDVTGSYLTPYLLGGSVQILAGSFGFIIMCLVRRRARYSHQREAPTDTINTLDVAPPADAVVTTKESVVNENNTCKI